MRTRKLILVVLGAVVVVSVLAATTRLLAGNTGASHKPIRKRSANNTMALVPAEKIPAKAIKKTKKDQEKRLKA